MARYEGKNLQVETKKRNVERSSIAQNGIVKSFEESLEHQGFHSFLSLAYLEFNS